MLNWQYMLDGMIHCITSISPWYTPIHGIILLSICFLGPGMRQPELPQKVDAHFCSILMFYAIKLMIVPDETIISITNNQFINGSVPIVLAQRCTTNNCSCTHAVALTCLLTTTVQKKLQTELASCRVVQNGSLNASSDSYIYNTSCALTIGHNHDCSC